ncbi:MAG: methyltransferase, CheR-type [Verrucomicrobiales bacterium]|nr:methyltransferase, CheR-type [Verrucomicrobiales bacterium]
MSRPRKYTPELENIEIELLLEGVAQHYGFEFQEYANAPLRRRIWQTIRREKVRTISGLQEKLLHDYSAMERFLAALSERGSPNSPAFYVTFRSEVVPLLRTYPFVRIWHAGCTSARELYTLAIVLHEEGLYDKSTIYATDVNEQSLKRVSDGVFPLAAVAEYTALYRDSGGKEAFTDYFSGGGRSGIFDEGLKRNIVFGQHNLATDSSFNEFNTILCRNVLSAYNEGVQVRAHKVLYDSLALFGILGLGPRESISASPTENCYAELDAEHRLYRKIR